VNLINDVVRME